MDIHDVGRVGAADGGQSVHFELIDPGGREHRVVVPYDRMQKILFALQTADGFRRKRQAPRI